MKETYVSTTVQAKEVCEIIILPIARKFSLAVHSELENLFSVKQFTEYSPNFPNQHLETAFRTFPFLGKTKFKTIGNNLQKDD